MKKFTIILLLLTPVFLQAQYTKPTRIFGEGQVDLQPSLGLFPTYVADKPDVVLPPLNLGLRWLVSDHFSLGFFTGYSSSRSREKLLFNSIRGRWYNRTWFFGLEGGCHYTRIDNWDLYGGLSLFYQYIRVESSNSEFEKASRLFGVKERSGKAALSAFVGARFALAGRYNVFTELGYGVSILRIGMGYRL